MYILVESDNSIEESKVDKKERKVVFWGDGNRESNLKEGWGKILM